MKTKEGQRETLLSVFREPVQVSLHDGGTELSYPGYERMTAKFTVSAEPAAYNTETIRFAECIASKPKVSHVMIWSNGVARYVGRLSKIVEFGHKLLAEFEPKAIVVKEE
jgi:hypothetical protein